MEIDSLTTEQKTRLREGVRTCNECGDTKHVSLFSAHLVRSYTGKVYIGFRRQCKACRAKQGRLERALDRVPRNYDRTPERCDFVRSLVLKGLSHRAIAKVVRCDPKTLRRRFATELLAERLAA